MRIFDPLRKIPEYVFMVGRCVLIAALCLSIIALITYNPHDESWLYEDSMPRACNNALGAGGAYMASVLIALFGQTIYVLLILIGVMLVGKANYHDLMQRLAGFTLIISSLAWFLTSEKGDGGALGDFIFGCLAISNGLGNIVIIALLWASLVLILGCSWLGPLSIPLPSLGVRRTFSCINFKLQETLTTDTDQDIEKIIVEIWQETQLSSYQPRYD